MKYASKCYSGEMKGGKGEIWEEEKVRAAHEVSKKRCSANTGGKLDILEMKISFVDYQRERLDMRKGTVPLIEHIIPRLLL
jgi:hypothetical protein